MARTQPSRKKGGRAPRAVARRSINSRDRLDGRLPRPDHGLTAKVTTKTAAGANSAREVTLNDDLCVMLKETLRGVAWKEMKFVATETHGDKMATDCFMQSGVDRYTKIPGNPVHNAQVDKNIMEDIQAYMPFLIKCHNEMKSDVQASMKKVCRTYMKKHGGILPTLAEIKKVIRRELDLNNNIFKWWWDKALPCAGEERFWAHDCKCFNLTSDCRINLNPMMERCITHEDEAFCAVVCECCRDKWQAWFQWETNNPLKRLVVKKNRPKGDPDCDGPDVMFKHTSEDPQHAAKHTNPHAGCGKKKGWTKEGVQAYISILDDCKKARRKKRSRVVEKTCLDSLRAERKITAETAEEHNMTRKPHVDLEADYRDCQLYGGEEGSEGSPDELEDDSEAEDPEDPGGNGPPPSPPPPQPPHGGPAPPAVIPLGAAPPGMIPLGQQLSIAQQLQLARQLAQQRHEQQRGGADNSGPSASV